MGTLHRTVSKVTHQNNEDVCERLDVRKTLYLSIYISIYRNVYRFIQKDRIGY